MTIHIPTGSLSLSSRFLMRLNKQFDLTHDKTIFKDLALNEIGEKVVRGSSEDLTYKQRIIYIRILRAICFNWSLFMYSYIYY
jgi:hypothetical protein